MFYSTLKLFYLGLAIFFVLATICEFLFTRHKDKYYYNIHDYISSLKLMGLALIFDVILKLLFITVLFSIWYIIPWHHQPTLWCYVICFFAWDFIFYIKHFLEHNIRILWAVHHQHHSSKYFNLSTALRSGTFKGLYRYFFYIPIIIIGIHPFVFFVIYGIGKLWAFFSHSQKLGHWGMLEYIFVTPSHHAVHHSCNENNIGKNFGETLIIWDKIFGTFQEKKGTLIYGVTDKVNTSNLNDTVLFEFKAVYDDFNNAKTWKEKCLTLFQMKRRTTNNENSKHIVFKKIHYAYKEQEIYKVLKQRVKNYFIENNLSPYANTEVVIKITLIFVTICIGYISIILQWMMDWQALIMAIIVGFASMLLGFNVAHDAAHQSLSKHRWINAVLARSMCFIGCSNYVWHLRHNLSHHANNNIPEYDWTTYAHKKILTSDKHIVFRILSRYPHMYTPFLYCFYFIFLSIYKDFEIFFTKQVTINCYHQPTRMQTFSFVSSKLLYFFFVLLLPIYLLPYNVFQIVGTYILTHMVSGILFAAVAIPPHLTEEAVFPTVDDMGVIDHSRFTHNIDTTTDFACNSKLMNWFFGGFNTHAIHHLFPKICHVHYIELTKILKKTLAEYDYPYKERSLSGAIISHYYFLKNLAIPSNSNH